MSTFARTLAAVAFTLGSGFAAGGVEPALTVELVVDGLSAPLFLTSPAGDPDRLFVLEQFTGRVRVIKNGALEGTPFLDIGTKIGDGGFEQGLLGLAFHPDYDVNGRFFVSYTRVGGDSVIEEYEVSAGNPDIANAAAVGIILVVDQPALFQNHNGGWIGFGPDGFLYAAYGDGGGGFDPLGSGQQTNTLLGKMLRLDVAGGDDFPGDSNRNYAIPGDNPFEGSTTDEEEIWAYGLRNPWRNSFDRMTGDLWIADVGQNAFEEVNFQPASSEGGENYGWDCREATTCTGQCTCPNAAFTDPIHEFAHALSACGGGNAASVTGGYVYRGAEIPEISGVYFFGDYCQQRIWSFRYLGGVKSEFTDRTAELAPTGGRSIDFVTSFGEDANGELYIVDQDGEIWRLIAIRPCPADLTGDGTVGPEDLAQLLGAWGPGGGAADLTNDGVVGPEDLGQLLGSWGPCP